MIKKRKINLNAVTPIPCDQYQWCTVKKQIEELIDIKLESLNTEDAIITKCKKIIKKLKEEIQLNTLEKEKAIQEENRLKKELKTCNFIDNTQAQLECIRKNIADRDANLEVRIKLNNQAEKLQGEFIAIKNKKEKNEYSFDQDEKTIKALRKNRSKIIKACIGINPKPNCHPPYKNKK